MKKSKKLDFLPNINNKYSIRKFTVGTASILLGVTLIFGASNDEAKAAEKEGSIENVESNPTSNEGINDQNLNREETPETVKEDNADIEVTTKNTNEDQSNSTQEKNDTNENTPELTSEPTTKPTDNKKQKLKQLRMKHWKKILLVTTHQH